MYICGEKRKRYGRIKLHKRTGKRERKEKACTTRTNPSKRRRPLYFELHVRINIKKERKNRKVSRSFLTNGQSKRIGLNSAKITLG